MTRRIASIGLLAGIAFLCARTATAQPIDMSQGGPITVTAENGLEWQQDQQEVIATGNARAVRGNVTVTADKLIAHYRRKAEPPGTPGVAPGVAPAAGAAAGAGSSGAGAGQAAAPAKAAGGNAPATPAASKPDASKTGASKPDATTPPAKIAGGTAAPADPTAIPGAGDTGNNEIYRLEAIGDVHIDTQTDHATGDHATYDIDQAVLLLTGHNLKVVTPNDTLTSRDSMEYWTQKHMAVARGEAVVVTNDGRRISGDVLVAYTTDDHPPPRQPAHPAATPVSAKPGAPTGDPLTSSGKLQKVDAIGNVIIRTQVDYVSGDRAVYVPDTGIARVAGHVHITRGQNQLNGEEAEVNLKTNISRLLSSPSGGRVQGLVMPNDASAQTALPGDAAGAQKPGAQKPAKPAAGPASGAAGASKQGSQP